MTWSSMEIPHHAYQDVAIAAGASLTAEIDMAGYSLLRIEMPAAWTAASLTFQIGAVTGAVVNHYLDGVEYTKQAAASRSIGVIPVDATLLQRYLKVRSGTSGTPVAQAEARTLRLVGVKILA